MFKQNFIFVAFSDDFVYYLPKKMKKGGPWDGSAPRRVAVVERRF